MNGQAKSVNMRPSPTRDYISDVRARYVELLRKGRVRIIAGLPETSNLDHILSDEFSLSVSLASRWIYVLALTALTIHVGVVVGARSQKQMVRTAARPIVAVVEYAQPMRDRSINGLPDQSMNVHQASAKPHVSITTRESTSPYPARIGFLNAAPDVVSGVTFHEVAA